MRLVTRGAQFLLNPLVGGIQQVKREEWIVNPEAAVVEHQVEVEAGLLDVDRDHRLQSRVGGAIPGGQCARVDVLPRKCSVSRLEWRRGFSGSPQVQAPLDRRDLVGNNSLDQICQASRVGTVAGDANIEGVHLEDVTVNRGLTRTWRGRGLHVAGDALFFDNGMFRGKIGL